MFAVEEEPPGAVHVPPVIGEPLRKEKRFTAGPDEHKVAVPLPPASTGWLMDTATTALASGQEDVLVTV